MSTRFSSGGVGNILADTVDAWLTQVTISICVPGFRWHFRRRRCAPLLSTRTSARRSPKRWPAKLVWKLAGAPWDVIALREPTESCSEVARFYRPYRRRF
jgi:hypothetical protein